MTPKETLGEFEHQVLLAILRHGGESYSVPIVLELEEKTGREVAPAAVYIALRRLEERGLVRSHKRRGPNPEGGRERRYFSLEDKAVGRLRDSRRAFEGLWEGLDEVFEDA